MWISVRKSQICMDSFCFYLWSLKFLSIDTELSPATSHPGSSAAWPNTRVLGTEHLLCHVMIDIQSPSSQALWSYKICCWTHPSHTRVWDFSRGYVQSRASESTLYGILWSWSLSAPSTSYRHDKMQEWLEEAHLCLLMFLSEACSQSSFSPVDLGFGIRTWSGVSGLVSHFSLPRRAEHQRPRQATS